MTPRRSAQAAAKKRRKDILMGLLAATGITGLGGLVFGPLRLLFVVSLVLTVAYVALLAQAQKRVLERRSKVRYLGSPASVTPSAPVAWDDEYWTDEAYDEPTADGTYPSAELASYPQAQSAYVIARH